MRSFAILLVGVLASRGAWASTPSSPLDARLETSTGAAVRLAERLGRPLVLFYEDRESKAQNQ